MEWSFRKMSRGEIFNDPYQREFFTQEGLADALIRESIQNSLDASLRTGPVRVRFHLSGDGGALESARWQQYLSGLLPHIEAFEPDRIPRRAGRMPYLVIEDFGTRGLCGSVDQDSDETPQGFKYRDFFYFWRNIGRSKKQDVERGRWGIGKTVFPASSKLSSFFGLTNRSEDNKSLLMGQSVLKIHSIGNAKYCPYGFWALVDGEGFQRPSDDKRLIDEFKNDFRLTRKSEPGVSLVIPFPDFGDEDEAGAAKIKPDQMIRSAILHYFYPILRQELVVVVSEDGHNTEISHETIDAITEVTQWQGTGQTSEQLKRLFDLVRKTLSISDEELLVIPEPPRPAAPDWLNGRFSDEVQASIKRQFLEKNLLAICVQLTVYPKAGQKQATFFKVFVERDETLTRADDHYIRQGITISEIKALKERGFRGLVLVDDKPLSTLLGDSENPAHTQWQERATKLKERYDWGPYTVRFVRNALQRIIAQLLFVPESRDDQLLKDIFNVKDPNSVGNQRAGGRRKDKSKSESDESEVSPVPPLPPSRSPFQIQQTEDGFRIKHGTGAAVKELCFEVAYEVRRGNAFDRYDKRDFQMQNLEIDPIGATFEADGNRLLVRPFEPEFLVDVKGFDRHRDLAIRDIAIREGQGDVEAV